MMMCIIVFSKFFTRSQNTLHDDFIQQNSRQAAREIRRARFHALLHEHTFFLLEWTLNNSEMSRNDDKSSESKATSSSYNQDSKTFEMSNWSQTWDEDISRDYS